MKKCSCVSGAFAGDAGAFFYFDNSNRLFTNPGIFAVLIGRTKAAYKP